MIYIVHCLGNELCELNWRIVIILVNIVGKELGLGFAGIGFEPKWPLSERPSVSKVVASISLDKLPQLRTLKKHVMYCTCVSKKEGGLEVVCAAMLWNMLSFRSWHPGSSSVCENVIVQWWCEEDQTGTCVIHGWVDTAGQVNLDYDSEQDMINKLRVRLSFQPIEAETLGVTG